MGILDDLKPLPRVYGCFVHKKIAEFKLSESDAEILLAAIDDKEKWTSTTLESALRVKGIRITRGTLERHRNRVCGCE